MSGQSLRRGIARGVSWSRQGEAVTTKDREQLERIRERFTRTAQSFAQFALGARGEEAERLARIVVPEGADSKLNNRIERTRDPSHASTLTSDEFTALLEAAPFRSIASETSERRRQFDDWMQIMGLLPGSSGYAETRRLMETSMPGDTAGFHPRFVSGGGTAAATASG